MKILHRFSIVALIAWMFMWLPMSCTLLPDVHGKHDSTPPVMFTHILPVVVVILLWIILGSKGMARIFRFFFGGTP